MRTDRQVVEGIEASVDNVITTVQSVDDNTSDILNALCEIKLVLEDIRDSVKDRF